MILDFATVASPRARSAPAAGTNELPRNLAYALTVHLEKFTEAFCQARPFLKARRRERSRWGVPELFYYEPAQQQAYEQSRSTPSPQPHEDHATRRAQQQQPQAYRAWRTLLDRSEDTLTLLRQGVAYRRIARADVAFCHCLEPLRGEHPHFDRINALLNLTDETTIILLDLDRRQGIRLEVHGLGRLSQILDWLVEAQDRSQQAPIPCNQQLLHPAALGQPLDQVTTWAGVDFWFWGHESVKWLPELNGERLLAVARSQRIRYLEGPTEIAGVRPHVQVVGPVPETTLRQFWPQPPSTTQTTTQTTTVRSDRQVA